MDALSIGIIASISSISSTSVLATTLFFFKRTNTNPTKTKTTTSKKIQGKFIRISNSNIVCMHISKLIVSSGKNDDIAFNKPVTMSSRLDSTANYIASNVTDSDTNTYNHTSCGDSPWILVDLEFVTEITKIIVVNRQDCCQQRINGTIVEILNENKETVWESEPFKDKLGSIKPVYDSNLNQYGYDRFTITPPNTNIVGERNKY